MIRILVIDDSAFMRKALTLMLETDPDLEVVGIARDGQEGFEKTLELQPDLITLDIDMPRMNGLDCLNLIMSQRPTPVLVVSALTRDGAEATLEALDSGAADFITKTQTGVALDVNAIQTELLNKVKAIASNSRNEKLGMNPGATSLHAPNVSLDPDRVKLIVIGVSTGGPPVIQRLLAELPADYPVPIVVAQHMPAEFTNTFARRLDDLTEIHVKEGEDGETLRSGIAYVGPGGHQIRVKNGSYGFALEVNAESSETLYRPSADILVESAAQASGSGVVGLILTGMGRDGVHGLASIKARGGKVLAQDEASCMVYGMPRAAVEAQVVDDSLPVQGLQQSLLSLVVQSEAVGIGR